MKTIRGLSSSNLQDFSHHCLDCHRDQPGGMSFGVPTPGIPPGPQHPPVSPEPCGLSTGWATGRNASRSSEA